MTTQSAYVRLNAFTRSALLIAALWGAAAATERLLASRHIATGFGFLLRAAGFDIGESLISFDPEDTIARALVVGTLNTLKVSVIGVSLATIIAAILTIARIGSHPLTKFFGIAFVELVRNVPLLLQLFFWYGILTIAMPGARDAFSPIPGVYLSNRGLWLPSLNFNGAATQLLVVSFGALLLTYRLLTARAYRPLIAGCGAVAVTVAAVAVAMWGHAPSLDAPRLEGLGYVGGTSISPELAALAFGLAVYASSYLSEIACAALNAVPQGQWQAARALGMKPIQVLRLVIAPQAARIALLPAVTEYLNLLKNSSLAVAIGYPDIVSIGNTVMNQTGQAIEVIVIFVGIFLSFCLAVAAIANGLLARWIRRVQ